MLKKIGIGVAVALVAFAVLAALQAPTYVVSRSATVPAPPDQVFAVLNSFKNFSEWSPWSKRDPALKTTLRGSESGPGAIYEWAGNDQVGQGRMTILESKPNQSVVVKLEFLKPFASVADTTFTLAPDGDGTRVTWAMVGHLDYMGKVMGLFMNWDKMIGPDFEKGLAALGPLVKRVASTRGPGPG